MGIDVRKCATAVPTGGVLQPVGARVMQDTLELIVKQV